MLARGAGAEDLSHTGVIRTNSFPFHSFLLRCKQWGKESYFLLSVLVVMIGSLPLEEEGSSSEDRLGFLPSAPSWNVLRKLVASLLQAGTGPALSRGDSRRELLGCTWMSNTSNHPAGTVSTWWPLTEASSARKFRGWLVQVGRLVFNKSSAGME